MDLQAVSYTHLDVYKRQAGYSAIMATPNENTYLLDKVPDFYERLKNSYDDNFYQQEALGQYLSQQGGLVYSCLLYTSRCV